MTSREHDVAALADLPDGTMQAVTAGDTKVLLARIGGTVHAVSGTCPQAGGPLAEGVQIVVNGTLQAADALFAAGDIAAFSHTGNGPPIRVEHWRVAQQHGRVAARNMLGRGELYDAVPVFWTIQYMKRLDYVGHAADWDYIEIEGKLEPPNFLAYCVREDRVAAVAGFDRDSDVAAMVLLMQTRADWTPDRLRAALQSGATDICGQGQSA